MTITFKVIGTLLLASLPGLAFAQGTKPKENKALEQLKDVNRSSQDAASTRNEPSKAKSNQNIDTATKPAVRAGDTKPTTQQQAIQRFEQSGRPTGEAQRARLSKPIEVPSPGATAKPAVAKPVPQPVATSTSTVSTSSSSSSSSSSSNSKR